MNLWQFTQLLKVRYQMGSMPKWEYVTQLGYLYEEAKRG